MKTNLRVQKLGVNGQFCKGGQSKQLESYKVQKVKKKKTEENVDEIAIKKCYRLEVMTEKKLIYYCQATSLSLINWRRGVQSLVKSQQISARYLNN